MPQLGGGDRHEVHWNLNQTLTFSADRWVTCLLQTQISDETDHRPDQLKCATHSALRHDVAGTRANQLQIENMTASNGEYSGDLVSIEDAKIWDQLLELDLTFHVKQPAPD